MCGIAGCAGDFVVGLVARMNAAQAHRGPDDAGILFHPDEGIGLAHRRLSIIDLSPLDHQPMQDMGDNAAIVVNGEILCT